MSRERRKSLLDVVLQGEGPPLPLHSLFEDRKIVLVFLRHFGCTFAKKHITDLHQQLQPQLLEDIPLVAIGIGTQDQIGRFKKETGFDGELYVDVNPWNPESYGLLSMRSGDSVFGEDAQSKQKCQSLAEVSKSEGHDNGGYPTPDGQEYTGNIRQIGGVFVLGPGLHCDFSYRSSYAGDFPDTAAILTAATGSAGDSEMVYPSTQHWLDTLQSHQPYRPPPSTSAPTSKQGWEDRLKYASICVSMAAAAVAYLRANPSSIQTLSTSVKPYFAPGTFIGDWVAVAGPGLQYLVLVAVAWGMGLLIPKLPSWVLGRPTAATTSTASSGEGGQLVRPKDIKLMTPTDIDVFSMENGCVDCDCSFVAGTDMVHKVLKAGLDPSSVTTPSRPTEDPSACAQIHELSVNNCYLREFLAKPHPLLGRKGPTCPFVPKSLKLNSIYIGKVSTPPDACPSALQTSIEQVVRHFLAEFPKLEPREGSKKIFKAIILLFPDVPLHLAPEVIDGTQKSLKAEFVKQGLMIGEFHLANNSSGLRNDSFFPLRTPYPSLALRHMVPTDVVFMSSAHYTLEQRKQFLQGYIDCMKNDPSKKAKQEVEEARKMLSSLQ